jgi:4-hydroxy-tetrahydrodipicolinate reductase
MKIKVGIAGATGRMGQLIIEQIIKDDLFSLAAATTSANNPLLGTIVADHVFLHSNPEELFTKGQVVIDFTKPDLLKEHLTLAVQHKTKLVIGTTGLTAEHKEMLLEASKQIPLLYASNTSMGVTLMKVLTTQISKVLGSDFDIEIDEIHHRHKVDAPSGTSLSLGEAAAKGRGVSLKDVTCFERHGHTGPRPAGQIGFSVRRGGSIVGDHTVSFIGEDELSLIHI